MSTIKELSARIKELDKKLDKIGEFHQHVVEINRRFRILSKNGQDLSQFVRCSSEKIEVDNIFTKPFNEIRDTIMKLEEEIKEKRSKKTEKALESFFYPTPRFSIGTTSDNKSRVIGVKSVPWGFTNALIYVPAHTEYVSRMTGSVYCESELFIVKEVSVENNKVTGSIWNKDSVVKIAEGIRLTPRELMKHEDKIREYIPDFVSIVPPKGYSIDYFKFKQSGK